MANNDKYEERKRESERMPIEESPKTEETPLTRDEVQGIVNSLVDSIKNILDGFQERFADKTAINAVYNNILREITRRQYINKKDAKDIAKDAVPPSLRGLDSDVLRKYGTTLRLVSSLNGDQACWGTEEVAAALPGFPYNDKVFFGLKHDPDGDDSLTKVRIYAGEIDRIAVAQADLTVANNDFAYVRRTIADDTMLITNGGTVPDDDDTYKYYKLYQFAVTPNEADPPVYKASVLKICRVLAIEGGEGGAGFEVLGDKVLYKGIFLREYDEDGVIVAAGSEINPADYATQELYDAALVAAGHTLKATWDYTRAHG